MALSNSMTVLVSSILAVVVFSGMQLYRNYLTSSGPFTILGGGLGALLFLFTLTAVGNLELMLFGRAYQTGLFPEIVGCLLLSLIVSGAIHGVCLTTCFLFSLILLYYINQISQKAYASNTSSSQAATHHHQKKK